MLPNSLLRPGPVAQGSRRPARDIIDAVVENMRKNLEPLKYSTLAPSRFTVYLHPMEFVRLEGIIPILQEQTTRALSDELIKLNRRPAMWQRVGRWGSAVPEVRNAADWQVDFLADPDGDMNEGDLLVDSELILPASPELGVGERTRRITTMHAGQQTSTREQTMNRQPEGVLTPTPVFARIEYEDTSGPHVLDLTKDSITIGRGGIAYPVDVRITSSPDVSREHARIRRDPSTGRFFLIDLSSLGTTLNGRHVPKGYDEVDGARRENGSETQLPDSATIGLADTVFLKFTVRKQ
jgi:hypothetical protein